VDGNVTKIPVEVTVWGYEISDETHSRSTWAVMFDNNKYGEANLTKFMEKVYVDNLLDFRLNPQNVPVLLGDATNFKEAKINEWLDSVVEYSQDPRCSYINIPTNAQTNVTVNGVVYSRLTNMDLYSKTLTAIAKRSLEEEINLFEKMDMWLNFLDESEQNGNVDNLEMSTLLMKQKQAEFATEWKAAVEAGTWFAGEGYSYDKDFAYEQYSKLKTHFWKNSLISGLKEYYKDVFYIGLDMDAGPIIFELSPTGTAFCTGSATFFNDTHTRIQILKTAEIAGHSILYNEKRHYLLANIALVGESIMLAMRTNYDFTE
jgi:hypothetical protein